MKRKLQHLILLLGSLVALAVGCNRGDVLDEKITQAFGNREFTWVSVKNVFNVFLVQDTTWSVSVTGMPKVMEGLDISYEGDTLILDRTRKGEYLRPKTGNPDVYLHFDSLKRVTAYQTCHISSLNAIKGREFGIVDNTKLIEVDLDLDNRTFFYWNTPNGSRIRLKGKTLELKLWHLGLSSVDASELDADWVNAENQSQGECRIHVNNELLYKLESTGDIVYSGNPPTITKLSATGTGKLVHEN
jgi:hypothetical protein